MMMILLLYICLNSIFSYLFINRGSDQFVRTWRRNPIHTSISEAKDQDEWSNICTKSWPDGSFNFLWYSFDQESNTKSLDLILFVSYFVIFSFEFSSFYVLTNFSWYRNHHGTIKSEGELGYICRITSAGSWSCLIFRCVLDSFFI